MAIGILDFYHACQYLWSIAKIWLDGRTKDSKQWYLGARYCLRNGLTSILENQLITVRNLSKYSSDDYKKIDTFLSYLHNHKDHIDYANFKQQNLPIGSGMVESACKWLIQQRFKGTGMRWSVDGFDNLLHIRLAWVNQRFNSLFDL